MKINQGNLKAAIHFAKLEADKHLAGAEQHTKIIAALFACGLTGKQIKVYLQLEGYSVVVNQNYFAAVKDRYSKQIKLIKCAMGKVSQTEAIQLCIVV